MTDKELIIKGVLEQGKKLTNKLFGVTIGNITNQYLTKLIEKQLTEKFKFIDLFFDKEQNLIEPDMFFESAKEMIEQSQINVMGVSLDNSFIEEIKDYYILNK